MRRFASILAATLCVGALSACASIVRSSYQRIELITDPPGASVLVLPLGRRVETPATVKLERDRAATLFVWHHGYMPRQVFLDPSEDPAALWPFAGNILLGGIFGMSIDVKSGALYHLTPYPEPSVERLEPETRWLLRLEEAELDESAEPLDQLSEESDVEDSD